MLPACSLCSWKVSATESLTFVWVQSWYSDMKLLSSHLQLSCLISEKNTSSNKSPSKPSIIPIPPKVEERPSRTNFGVVQHDRGGFWCGLCCCWTLLTRVAREEMTNYWTWHEDNCWLMSEEKQRGIKDKSWWVKRLQLRLMKHWTGVDRCERLTWQQKKKNLQITQGDLEEIWTWHEVQQWHKDEWSEAERL